ncbi:RNA repair domain-containing protein [Dactylosporangium sp. NPDC049525]|uniref:RNA repair domain-containing protein n=1 Tax=Dactylosporangium sp. NPDC049525 TaxID=3154730 RepID=UPI003429A4E7
MAKGRGTGSLRPVQDVVSRIRFDAALDATRFVVGYEERGAGIRESPLPLFVAGGDVPWHRVRYVKAGDLTVWDRHARVDLVFGTGDTPAADLTAIGAADPGPRPAAKAAQRTGRQIAFDPAACLRFDPAAGAWVPAGPPGDVRVDAVQVATFNVLSDAYDRDLTYPDQRVPACVEVLQGLGADVVALHEVTPALWDTLLAAAWVRAGYHVSVGPDPAAGYGTVLLARWPLAIEVHRLSAYKRTVLGLLDLNGRRVGFVAAHLTSDHTAGAEQRREHQLRIIDERLGRGDLDGAVVLADLNFGDDARPDVDGYTDPWRVLRPHDAGFTFDPAVNPLAALASVTGRPRRLDRILVRAGTPGGLVPLAVERFAEHPFDGDRFVSDHFGVTALLQDAAPSTVVTTAPVHTSALVLRPPPAVWAPLQAIRAAHDPSFQRWMPHVNLVYGFVPEAGFPAAAAAVREAVAGLGPLRIRLETFRTFEHRGSTTVWLEPAPTGPLRELQALLAQRFPGCVEQDSRGGFTPHLTVAKLTGSDVAARVRQWQAEWVPLEFTVSSVELISRRDGEPFAVRDSVALGGVADAHPAVVALPAWSRLPSPAHGAALHAVADACAAVDPGTRLHVVGSVRLGIAGPATDLDLVWATAAPDALAGLAGLLDGARLAGSVVPVVRATVGGVGVDVQRVRADPGDPALDLGALDDADLRAVLAVRDADALPAADAGFRALLGEVRAWSRDRQLDGAAWGLVGGFSWAVLVAEARAHYVTDLAGFLRHCAGHPRRPRRGERHAYWPVYSPTPPGINTTRSMTRSTAAVLQEAFEGGGSRSHEHRVLLAGDVEGRVLGLILALEDVGARVRPYPRAAALGVDGGDPEVLRATVAASELPATLVRAA